MNLETKIAFFMMAFLASGLFAAVAPADQAGSGRGELAFRQKLGIPAEAKKVIVFAQSSHVDPDWLLTADQYQRLLTDKTFDRALIELEKDPRYIYSVECTFFFKRYWDSRPEKQKALRDYVNRGRIRFTGTGVTSPDTLLPEPENLIRDYLIGQQWLKKQGMDADPKVAYYADSFGHTPSLPAILREIGYKYAAFTRIDGMYFISTDYRPAGIYPLRGSSAELLQKKYRTLDFVWQSPDKSEVIAHWNAFAYFQADMIDHAGSVATYGIKVGFPARSARSTNNKIDSYIRKLDPLSPTGYMFCAAGGDFNPPVRDLVKILDAYNKDRYPKTGVYAVLAGIEDYFKLVEFHKSDLPVIQLDPNPLFMGFYASRPGLKQAIRKLSRSLVLAEMLGVAAEDQIGPGNYPELSAAWEASAFSNHHDFITGTGRDSVVKEEQMPVVLSAQDSVDRVIESLSQVLAAAPKPVIPKMQWRQSGAAVEVENEFYQVRMDGDQGGCITSWFDKKAGREILSGPSNDLVLYYDNGGLWRMGNEIALGKLKEKGRTSAKKAALSAFEQKGMLVVTVSSKMDGRDFIRTLYFRGDQPVVRMKLRAAAARRQAIAVRFQTRVSPGRLIMEIPYSVVERPLEKLFQPTFWPAKNWVDLEDGSENFGAGLALSAPAAVSGSSSGRLELVALRNAYQERVLGIPLFAFPATGSDPDEHEIDYAFFPHSPGDWRQARVFAEARNAMSDSWTQPQKPGPENPAAIVQTDRDDVVVTALKKAESGNGVIVRLFRYTPDPVSVRITFKGRTVKKAFLVDGLEREKAPLLVRDGKIELEMPYYLATVLLEN